MKKIYFIASMVCCVCATVTIPAGFILNMKFLILCPVLFIASYFLYCWHKGIETAYYAHLEKDQSEAREHIVSLNRESNDSSKDTISDKDIECSNQEETKYVYGNEDKKNIVTKENIMDTQENDLEKVNCVKSDAMLEHVRYEERVQRAKDEFDRILDSISVYPIKPNIFKYHKNNISDLSGIVYSNITAKSSLDRLGNYVCIDVETTGLRPRGNEIIEIAAIKLENFSPVSVFTTLVKPKKGIPEEITEITGITMDSVTNAPLIHEVIPSLYEFIDGFNIVAHNIDFDLKFLYTNGLDVLAKKRRYFDTLQIAQKILKKPRKKYDKELEMWDSDYDSDYDVLDHKLDTLCKYYGIFFDNHHRATADTLATCFLFHNLIYEKQSFDVDLI